MCSNETFFVVKIYQVLAVSGCLDDFDSGLIVHCSVIKTNSIAVLPEYFGKEGINLCLCAIKELF